MRGDGTPKWRYAVDDTSKHETRHEAVGAAAIINGRRDRIAPGKGSRASVWAYKVCTCEKPQSILHSRKICQRCGGQI